MYCFFAFFWCMFNKQPLTQTINQHGRKGFRINFITRCINLSVSNSDITLTKMYMFSFFRFLLFSRIKYLVHHDSFVFWSVYLHVHNVDHPEENVEIRENENNLNKLNQSENIQKYNKSRGGKDRERERKSIKIEGVNAKTKLDNWRNEKKSQEIQKTYRFKNKSFRQFKKMQCFFKIK